MLLAPGFEGIDAGLFLLLAQFIDAVGQIAQAGEHGGAVPAGGRAGIFTEGDVPAVMGAVFNGRPVAANDSQYLSIVALVEGQAGGITTDLKRGGLFRLVLVLGIALDGDNLPAAAQSDLLRRDGDSRDAPTIESAVSFLPLALRGENPAG